MQRLILLTASTLLAYLPPTLASGPQDHLAPIIDSAGPRLEFDWPMVRIGVGEYAEGPTGVTVFRFGRKVLGAVDVRGGGPGTVNTDYLRLGYEAPELDAVVFSGGSWYGLETTTAVASAMKDDGLRDGDWINVGLSVGAIIYDLGDRRLNEIYPDKPLAQAAYRAAQPGVFPLGAQGAGRSARTGGLFGCNAHSGQGGAYRQIGAVKIAAFTVVNALGVVTTRDGRVAACYGEASWPRELRTADLLADYPASAKPGWKGAPPVEARRNTTVSLVVTNQMLNPAELQRFAVQVHTSMARAIQPFATEFDGDVLYAVSTGEIDNRADPARIAPVELGVLASELMWDAVLASTPPQPTHAASAEGATLTPTALKRYAGEYVFSRFASVRITTAGGKLYAQASGARDAFAITRAAPVELTLAAGGQFMVAGRYPLTLQFEDGERLVLNPGRWRQVGVRRTR